MKTVAIKVFDLKNGQYPVELYEDDGGAQKPRAHSFIRGDLSLASPVLDSSMKPIDAARAKDDFKQGQARNFKQIGEYLYRVLFQGDVKEVWEELYANLAGAEGLRTILDIQPLSIRTLPWELIGEKDHLFLDAANPCSRGSIPFKTNVTPHAWPLRALIIVGSAHKDNVINAELEVESIVGPLREVSRTIEVDIMRRPSISDVVRRYENFQPHVIHYLGHGGSVGGKSYLRLYDKEGKPQNWTVDEIKYLKNVHGPWTASFAFINACRSDDKIGVDESQAIAGAFAAAGVPAVLSMLGDIKEEAAQTLAASIYEALAQGTPLDQAVARGRFLVSFSNKNIGLNTNQWALASLFLSVAPDKVLAIEYDIEEAARTRIRNDEELSHLHAFVDRLEHRLNISTTVDPRSHTGANSSLLIVKGGGRVGKTSMVKLCLECSAMRGRKVTWVNAKGGQSSKKAGGKRSQNGREDSITFLEVLRFIRDGDSSLNSLLSPRLDEQGAFSQFNWDLARLLTPKKFEQEASVASPNYEEPDETMTKRKLKGSPESLAPLFSRFRDALQKAAGEVPLVIVLDNMKIAPDHFNNVLIPHLILPIKRGEVSNVKLILVLSQKNETDYKEGLEQLGQYKPIEVLSFQQDEFLPLMLEFIRYNKDSVTLPREEVMGIVSAVDKTVKEPWKPEFLDTVLKVVLQQLAR